MVHTFHIPTSKTCTNMKKLQTENPHLATRIEFGLYLAFTRAHSPLYRPLSLNICREAFSYLGGDHIYLGSIQDYQLIVYDLLTESMQITVSSLNIKLQSAGLAQLDSNTMLMIGGANLKQVRSINIWTGTITKEAEMTESRAYPGLLLYGEFVWVFGGNTGNSLTSVERFHRTNRTWEMGPPMPSPKVAFTPCVHHSLIYLPCPNEKNRQLEVLDPATEMYTLLPLLLYSGLYGSVSFVVDSYLCVIDFNKQMGRWEIGSQDTRLTDMRMSVHRERNCYTNGIPIRCGEVIYWLNGNVSLAKFDLKTSTFSTSKTSMIKPA